MSYLEIPIKIEAEVYTRQYMTRTFQATKRNGRPCLKCNAVDHGLTIHKTYIRRPCRCCGADDHSMLSNAKTNEGYVTTIPTCPLIEFDGRSLSEQLSVDLLRYRACEERFAAHFGYNIERASEALDAFEKKGDGSFMIPYYCNLFKQKVLQICEEVRASWTFKRASIEDDSTTEELEL